MEIRYYKKALYRQVKPVCTGGFTCPSRWPFTYLLGSLWTKQLSNPETWCIKEILGEGKPGSSDPCNPLGHFTASFPTPAAAILVPTRWCRRPSRHRVFRQPEGHPHRCWSWTMPQAGGSCSRKPGWRSGAIWSRQGAEFPSMPAVACCLLATRFWISVLVSSSSVGSLAQLNLYLHGSWAYGIWLLKLPLFLLLECRSLSVLVKLLYPFSDRCSHEIMTLVSNYTCKGPSFSMCQ